MSPLDKIAAAASRLEQFGNGARDPQARAIAKEIANSIRSALRSQEQKIETATTTNGQAPRAGNVRRSI